jgi:competence protein ComEC
MITFAISFIAGIVAFKFSPFFPFSIISACIFIITALLWKYRGIRKKFIMIILIFGFGFLCSVVRQDTLPDIAFPDHDLLVDGTVVDVPETSGEKIRFTMSEVAVEGQEIGGTVQLVLYPKMFGNNFNGSLLDPGNRISALVKLKEPAPFRNPGVYERDLKEAGIAAVGYVKHMKLLGRNDGLLFRIAHNRQELGEIIDRSLSAENASFHKAIIPGLKKGISQEMRDAFSSTGLAHLLSISGTHFGLLAFICFSLARWIIKCLPVKYFSRLTLYITPTQIAVILTLPLLMTYAVLSGLSTPTVRSFIMVSIYMCALLLGRRGQWLNSLSVAAVAILLWQPDTLFELSFLLSFGAVLSIGMLLENRGSCNDLETSPFIEAGNKEVAGGMRKAYAKVETALLIPIAAVMGTAPIVALYFKQFPVIAPITNLLVTPFVCFIILPLGFVSGFNALIFNMTSMPFSAVIDSVTHFTLTVIKVLSQIPFSSVPVHNPSFAVIVIYYFSLLAIMKSRKKWRFLPLVVVICFYVISPRVSDHNLKIIFLDAGQGDASVVELPDAKVMIIDGSTHTPDMGLRVIAPYLWSKGIKAIDYMVVTHPHPDHYGGLMSLVDNFDVGEIWFNGRTAHGAEEFFQRARKSDIQLRILTRGDMLENDRYSIYVLHPYDEFRTMSPRGGFSDENSDSLVLKIVSGDTSILLTGDIEEEAEENLLSLGKWLKSDIIKVPHHGGRTSSSWEFIKAVNPRIAVASAGRNNLFQHPHHETIERYRIAGAKFFRTDVDGAITVTLREGLLHMEKYEDRKLKRVAGWQDEIRNLQLLF